jgi:hypothetical protein
MFRKHFLLMATAAAAMSVVGGGGAAAVTAYRIRDGFTFKGDDGAVKVGGETIELSADVAALHAHKLEPVEPLNEETKAPAPKPTRAPKAPPVPPAGDGTVALIPPAGDGTVIPPPPAGDGDPGAGDTPDPAP